MNRRMVLWVVILGILAFMWAPMLRYIVITPDLPTFLNVISMILTLVLVFVTIQWPYRLPFVLRRGVILGALWVLVNVAYVIVLGWPWINSLYTVGILGAIAFGITPAIGWYNYQKSSAPSDRELSDEEEIRVQNDLAKLQSQLEKVIHQQNSKQQALLWLQIGNLQKRLNEWDRTIEAYRQAVALLSGSRTQRLMALSNLGLAEIRDRPDLAAETFRQMHEASRLRNPLLRGILWLIGWPYQGAEIISLVNAGAAYVRTKQRQQALDVLEPATRLSRKYGYSAALVYALNNTGSALEEEPDKALVYYQQAERASRWLIGEPTAKVILTGNFADIHRRKGEFEQAFALLESLQPLVRSVKSRLLEGIVLRNLAKVYQDAGEAGHALALYGRAMDYAKATRHYSYAVAVLADVSKINVTLGRQREAIAALEQAITLMEIRSLPRDAEGCSPDELRAKLEALRSTPQAGPGPTD